MHGIKQLAGAVPARALPAAARAGGHFMLREQAYTKWRRVARGLLAAPWQRGRWPRMGLTGEDARGDLSRIFHHRGTENTETIKTRRRGDKETRRQGETMTSNLLVSPSPCLLVFPSQCPPWVRGDSCEKCGLSRKRVATANRLSPRYANFGSVPGTQSTGRAGNQ